jgi:hypothetical protein
MAQVVEHLPSKCEAMSSAVLPKNKQNQKSKIPTKNTYTQNKTPIVY